MSISTISHPPIAFSEPTGRILQNVSEKISQGFFEDISKNCLDWITNTADKIGSAAQFLIQNAGPYLRELSARVQQVYQHLTPYLSAAADFLRSYLGLSILSFVGSVTCIRIAEELPSRTLKAAAVGTGILLGATAALLLSASGTVPFLPQIQFV